MRTVQLGADGPPDFRYHEYYEPRNSRAATADCIPLRAGSRASTSAITPTCSGFEALARMANTMPPDAGDLLGVLLASAVPVGGGGCQVLRPLWAEEAMHRGLGLMRLVHARGGRRSLTGGGTGVADLDYVVARDLAFQFRELETAVERAVLPCAAALREVVTGLGTLFGDPANVILKAKIMDVSLPAYKRRALVLAAAELVSNALLHAFVGRTSGRIQVDLTTSGPTSGCLRVADNGIGFIDFPPNLVGGVAAGLAGLLEADLAYDRLSGWTIAEIAFPVSAD
jgi:hypothetical protein